MKMVRLADHTAHFSDFCTGFVQPRSWYIGEDNVGVFDRFFGKGRDAEKARKAELRGELAKAIELFVEAERPADAARVMVLRGDGETDHRARLQHYTHAARVAPDGTDENKLARKKRALLMLALAGDVTLSAVHRRDVDDAARELEAIGEHEKAAEAYAQLGDREGEARALTAAGDVDRLEFLLASEQHKERGERKRRDRQAEVDLLLGSGRRREALEMLDLLAREAPGDATVRERIASVRARLAKGPLVPISLHGTRLALAFAREIVVGRSEGTILVPSNAVSRRHVAIVPEAGQFVVRDLGSRNGTQLRGLPLRGALPIGEGLELTLGREVPLVLAPSRVLPGALDIEVAGQRVTTMFGRTTLGIGDWALVEAADGMLELSATFPTPFLAEVAMGDGSTLFVGDTFATTRGGSPALKVSG